MRLLVHQVGQISVNNIDKLSNTVIAETSNFSFSFICYVPRDT